MKLVILAGGQGSRLSEETQYIPKPMVEIGGMPMLWHIMKIYSTYGFNEFIICCGYKAHIIKEYFVEYWNRNTDITVHTKSGQIDIHNSHHNEDWKITLLDTGEHTNTVDRLVMTASYLDGTDFMVTYGDGLSDVNINELVKFHKSHNKIATILTTKPKNKHGVMQINSKSKIIEYSEKPEGDTWINSGFMVMNKSIFEYLIRFKDTMLEHYVLPQLSCSNELMAFKHHGFWKCMDTINDKNELEVLWNTKNPPWKVW